MWRLLNSLYIAIRLSLISSTSGLPVLYRWTVKDSDFEQLILFILDRERVCFVCVIFIYPRNTGKSEKTIRWIEIKLLVSRHELQKDVYSYLLRATQTPPKPNLLCQS